MSGWYGLLNDTVYYQSPTSYANNAITYGSTVSCIATWEDNSRTITNANGQEIVVSTEIISQNEIVEKSRVWFQSNTSDISNSREVRATRKFYDKINGDTMYLSWL